MKVKPEAIAEEGDILIACSAAGCLGRVARYSDPSKHASTDTHVAIARPNIELVEPDYLYAYLRGAQGQIQLRSRERGDWQREKISFRLTELNVADLRKVPVPLPDRAEQCRIVKEVEEIRAQVNLVRKLQIETVAEIDAMVPAVLDKAFRGEL
jgi:type I restriction enzyme S subunit